MQISKPSKKEDPTSGLEQSPSVTPTQDSEEFDLNFLDQLGTNQQTDDEFSSLESFGDDTDNQSNSSRNVLLNSDGEANQDEFFDKPPILGTSLHSILANSDQDVPVATNKNLTKLRERKNSTLDDFSPEVSKRRRRCTIDPSWVNVYEKLFPFDIKQNVHLDGCTFIRKFANQHVAYYRCENIQCPAQIHIYGLRNLAYLVSDHNHTVTENSSTEIDAGEATIYNLKIHTTNDSNFSDRINLTAKGTSLQLDDKYQYELNFEQLNKRVFFCTCNEKCGSKICINENSKIWMSKDSHKCLKDTDDKEIDKVDD